MVFVQAILTLLIRSAGKILNTVCGWATNLLFGKVPESRQTQLSIMMLVSMVWLVALLGIVFPRFAAFVMAFVPLPHWVPSHWIRITMIALVVLLPLGVGTLAIYTVADDKRPRGRRAIVKAILNGFPYTIGLALTLLLMLVLAPTMKVRDLLRRWKNAHVPMIVHPNAYLNVVADIEKILQSHGFETRRHHANWMIRFPTQLLTFFSGRAIDRLVAQRLMVLKAPDIEVLLHPSDLVIRGREERVARVRALFAEYLVFTEAYQTWSLEGNQLEDRLAKIWRSITSGDFSDPARFIDELHDADCSINRYRLPYIEWEVLFRDRMMIERRVLRAMAGLDDRPADSNAFGACTRT